MSKKILQRIAVVALIIVTILVVQVREPYAFEEISRFARLGPEGHLSEAQVQEILQQSSKGPVVIKSVQNDQSARLSQIPVIRPEKSRPDPDLNELRILGNRGPKNRPPSQTKDPVLQDSFSAPTANIASPLQNFEGVNNVNGVLPPDTNGDVGPNHYMQWVNLSFAIYSKTGTLLYGPAAGNTLWSGFGGACQTSNDGDPIVQYDHLADRWMVSQFALPNYPSGPFYQCIAVSQTSDPTGAWYRYSFLISNTKLNDYPHFGVWPDGYYMSINQFAGNSWGGAGAVAFERTKMLQGLPAQAVYFDLYSIDPNLGGMLPADLDGPAPAAGAPNVFAQMDDDAYGYSPDQLRLYNFHVDWANPSNSTFTQASTLLTAAFDSNMCNGSRNCIPQKGTRRRKLDAIADRLMYRLQYRNFGSYQTIVANQTVDAGGDHAGIRWYELRNTGGSWSIFQQGTYAPDATHRWMGSVAMDKSGNIGLGYSASSTNIYPSIWYTGRLAGDPAGQMTQGEGVIMNGSGYQSHSASRWGDYSSLSLDPDGCTFWFTSEYIQTSGSAPWQTRIGSFQLPGCSGGTIDTAPSVTITSPSNGATVSSTVNVTANASDDNGVTQVEFFVDGSSIGVDTSAPYVASWDTTAYGDGSHTVSATATDTASQTGNNSVNVTVQNGTGDNAPTVSITSPTNGATVSSTVNVTANASDDNGVEQVEFFVDGISIGVDTSAPYVASWDTTAYSNGSHTVSATATDTASQTGNDSVNVTVQNTVSSGTMHVSAIDMSYVQHGPNYTVSMQVTIVDENGSPVSGATVDLSLDVPGAGTSTGSATTGSNGTVTFSYKSKNTGTYVATVTNVSHSSYTFVPGANDSASLQVP